MAGVKVRRALRDRAFAVAVLVGAAPFVFLVGMSRFELIRAESELDRLRQTCTVVGERLDANDSLGQIAEFLRTSESAANQRIRIARRDGARLLEVDRSLERNTFIGFGDFFYGPAAPGLSMFESQAGPLALRPESLSGGYGEGVRLAVGGNLLVQAVNQWRTPEMQVHVQGYSRRAALPTFTTQRQIIKWASLSVAIALVAAWVLSRRLVAPIDRLREELLSRTASAVPKTPISTERTDEVGELARAFDSVFGALAEQKAVNESFMADLAHELKNPVAAIRACADVMMDRSLTPERSAKLTEVLHASAFQLDRLVTQFLELSRAEAGLPAEAREQVHLQALIDGLRSTFETDPRFATVTWRGERLPADVVVLGISSRLERAFGNLMLNALSFAGDAGWVQVDVRRVAGAVEVSTIDSGPGIAPEHLPRLFERFHTTRGDAKGTGLGLALTRAIIVAHGGTIHVSSPSSGGAAFVVQLPVA